ncbi:DUF2805 domain-containing protein [Asticcacaulis sp. AC402]|uniref:DUF2805 domain-containing protein n=1 Tax=Asticcacaulis sp. AC402 TaxID=1282361 RepID=UPI0003C3BB6B|nr:DUF2805 domain-containing protein [Asticcacaulis sp. AC402]ESQ75282.1 hypothetical protein ABAC402_09260 [Asticcacaulis sp. AC402]
MTYKNLDAATIDEIIDMALSDHIGFETIKHNHGLSADQVKALMRENLRTSRYRALRKRVRRMTANRASYK